MIERIRWSDDDRFFGPITVSSGNYRAVGVMLSSRDDEDRPANIRLQIGGLAVLAPLPGWLIRPKRTKVHARYWTAEDIARKGQDWYWNIDERELGFMFCAAEVHVHYGAQTQEWPGCKSKVFFYPWRCWRLERHTIFDDRGQRFADLPSFHGGEKAWVERHRIEDACPTVRFAFLDFDGEEIIATTLIDEYEHKLGEGRWKWLALFRRSKVTRSLDLQFSSEVGKRKGSWKGGTVGHSITMQPGEDHEAAFRRYCYEQDLTFVRREYLQ
jgi:hypothetical protein